MRVFLLFVRNAGLGLFFGALLSAVSAALYAYGVKLLNELIVSEQVSGSGLLTLVLVLVLSATLAIYAGYYLNRLYEGMMSEIRVDLLQKILKADFEVIEQQAFRILPVVNVDVNNLGMFAKNIPEILVALFKILAIVGFMFYLSWYLTLFVIGIFGLIFVFSGLFMKKFLRVERKILNQRNLLFRYISGLVEGIKELTLNSKHRSGYVGQTISAASVQYAKHLSKSGMLDTAVVKLAEVIVVMGLAVMLFLLKGGGGFSVEIFVEFLSLVLFLLPSLIVITRFMKSAKRVNASIEQIESLNVTLEGCAEILDEDNIDLKMNSANPLIELKDVVYHYAPNGGEQYGVGPINLQIKANEILFIHGGNGSGKTTLSKMLCGLYKPKEGQVLWQADPVTSANLFSFRDKFGAVFADSHVFEDLRYLGLKQDHPDFIKYCKLLGLDDKLSVEDMVIMNPDLSFGQRGRLNLLRALLEDKPVYLFDEWAANQDPYFKSKFYNEILPMLKDMGKTCIVISHDDHYYHLADRLVKMRAGNVEHVAAK